MQRPRVTNRNVLANTVAELLDIPYTFNRRTGPAAKAVNAIFAAITNALLRGEEVRIDGFGIFRIRTRKPTRSPCYYFYGRKHKGTYWEVKDLPEKRYVVFLPSKPLKRLINT
jgi:nucleoid DNA-binding protein